jgi:hypothetical protein
MWDKEMFVEDRTLVCCADFRLSRRLGFMSIQLFGGYIMDGRIMYLRNVWSITQIRMV